MDRSKDTTDGGVWLIAITEQNNIIISLNVLYLTVPTTLPSSDDPCPWDSLNVNNCPCHVGVGSEYSRVWYFNYHYDNAKIIRLWHWNSRKVHFTRIRKHLRLAGVNLDGTAAPGDLKLRHWTIFRWMKFNYLYSFPCTFNVTIGTADSSSYQFSWVIQTHYRILDREQLIADTT